MPAEDADLVSILVVSYNFGDVLIIYYNTYTETRACFDKSY